MFGVGVAIFAPLFEIWVLIAHRLKSAYMTVCFSGVDVGRDMEFPCFVSDVFCGSWTAPLANIRSLYV